MDMPETDTHDGRREDGEIPSPQETAKPGAASHGSRQESPVLVLEGPVRCMEDERRKGWLMADG